MTDADRPHSERYFTDARDHWWHADYLALLARRLGFDGAGVPCSRGVRRVLEVGVGQGHFARAIAPHLPAAFEFVGLDPEARSLAVASPRCDALGLDGTFAFVVGRAEHLPFADESFDLVMCQTLLIHLSDPHAAFAEMVRVCRRGGLILACEPNNLADLQRLALASPADLDPFLSARFAWRCTTGKARLGLGDNNLGARLPEFFGGLEDVRFAMNDRPWVMAPPYATPQQRAHEEDLRAATAEGVHGWERDEARRYYVAGGGTVEAFEADFDALLEADRRELEAIARGAHFELNAPAMLIASGRRA
jgi:SAM-dependent methyltransferase